MITVTDGLLRVTFYDLKFDASFESSDIFVLRRTVDIRQWLNGRRYPHRESAPPQPCQHEGGGDSSPAIFFEKQNYNLFESECCEFRQNKP